MLFTVSITVVIAPGGSLKLLRAFVFVLAAPGGSQGCTQLPDYDVPNIGRHLAGDAMVIANHAVSSPPNASRSLIPSTAARRITRESPRLIGMAS